VARNTQKKSEVHSALSTQLKKRLISSDSPSNASAAGDSLVMDNPSSSSGVVSFNRVWSTTKSKPVGAQDDSFHGDELIADLQADPVPVRTSVSE